MYARWCAFGESTMKPQNLQVCCGSSSPSHWNRYDSKGIYTDVTTTGCKFDANPQFFTSMSDKACGAELLGSARCSSRTIAPNSIYSQSKGGFRIYAQPVAGDVNFNYATARANGWQVNWCGVAKLPPSTSGAAGYPCAFSYHVRLSLALCSRHFSLGLTVS